MPSGERLEKSAPQLAVEAFSILLALALFYWAWRATPAWFERHWLELYCVRNPKTLRAIAFARVLSALAGALILFVVRGPLGRTVGRWAARRTTRAMAGDIARVMLAFGLALLACE